jgi:hypothetical protein
MKITKRVAAVAFAALLVGSVLGACTSSPSVSPTTTTTTTAPTTTTTAPPSTTTATTCQPSQLHIVVYGSAGAAGTIELTFSLTNTSTTTCTMYGYPGMQLLNASGADLSTNVIRGGGLTFESVAPTNVSLAPAQTAYYNLGYSDVPVGGETSCPTASQIEITPPNDTSYAVVPVSGFDACGGGTLHVSAVFASTDSAATSTTTPPQP